jgi:transposase InsO family protein
MGRAAARFGVGTRLVCDGEVAEIVEMIATSAGSEVVLRPVSAGGAVRRVSVRELLTADSARVVPVEDGPGSGDEEASASVVLAMLEEPERCELLSRAGHIREVLTGFKSGSAELAGAGEPRAEYDPALPLGTRYEAKAAELGIGVRTLRRWVGGYRKSGEAGLVEGKAAGRAPFGSGDSRWADTALEVMAEHTDQSKPSRTMVIERTSARVIARFGPGVVELPSRSTAFRVLEDLERRSPLFRLSAKRNRDIAARPDGVYGKLRPTRPGEYLLMDTTRLDVFALDPVTLRWLQAELTVAMDWYTRCICGIRITPVSTKSADAAAVLYQAFRPRPAGENWPRHAVWPEHGIPRSVLVDAGAVEGPMAGSANPAMVPETIVIDHGKIYVSEHLTSVCCRMGISVQPARLRTGRDKGPVERFFRTLREDLLQALPGYKGPDIHSRGLDPESEAFFYLDELEAIVREWVAVVYHHRPHDSLVDPRVPGLRMSPAAMFGHGMARAGYIEVPRDPDLAFEFLKVEWRTIQHYGVEFGGRRYNGPVLDGFRGKTSPYAGKAKRRWPVHYDPDDITRAWFRHPGTGQWGVLRWEHAPAGEMPFSEDALVFARRLAAAKYTYPDDRLAVADLLERWNLGLGSSAAERRIALRLSREAAVLEEAATAGEDMAAPPSAAEGLPAASGSGKSAGPRPEGAGSGSEPGDGAGDFGDDLFYRDALEDA